MTTKLNKPIAFFDMPTQQKVIGKDKILKSLETILDHGGYAQGPETKVLEERLAKYTGAKYCLTCSSGTDALILALMAWGVKSGDAVFVPSFTFVATAEAAAFLGATPIFVDSDEKTFNMSPKDLEIAIEETKKNTDLNLKAIIAVDIFGQPADYEAINKIAKENNMKVLGDAAQSFGAELDGKKAGSFADLTATSFYPTKPLGCYGDGGAVFCNTEEEYEILQSCRIHGMGGEKYDNIRLGLTGRMDSFQAAVLLHKMDVLDKEMEDRQVIAKRYQDGLKTVTQQEVLKGATSAWAIYTVLSENRDGLQAHLKEANVPCAAFYPRPVHTQTAYKKWATRTLPVCERLAKQVVSIPMHPYLEEDQQNYIIETINSFNK
jgi:dTDP-4-amino-4,6-dideoxygalactose transaminase